MTLSRVSSAEEPVYTKVESLPRQCCGWVDLTLATRSSSVRHGDYPSECNLCDLTKPTNTLHKCVISPAEMHRKDRSVSVAIFNSFSTCPLSDVRNVSHQSAYQVGICSYRLGRLGNNCSVDLNQFACILGSQRLRRSNAKSLTHANYRWLDWVVVPSPRRLTIWSSQHLIDQIWLIIYQRNQTLTPRFWGIKRSQRLSHDLSHTPSSLISTGRVSTGLVNSTMVRRPLPSGVWFASQNLIDQSNESNIEYSKRRTSVNFVFESWLVNERPNNSWTKKISCYHWLWKSDVRARSRGVDSSSWCVL